MRAGTAEVAAGEATPRGLRSRALSGRQTTQPWSPGGEAAGLLYVGDLKTAG